MIGRQRQLEWPRPFDIAALDFARDKHGGKVATLRLSFPRTLLPLDIARGRRDRESAARSTKTFRDDFGQAF